MSWRETNLEMVWHGEWADPDLVYKRNEDEVFVFNYWDIEDALWNEFLEDNEDVEDKDSGDLVVEARFNQYCKSRANDYCEDCIFGGYFNNCENNNWHDRKE